MKTRINLLPWRQALAERRRKYLLACLLAFACAALAAVWLADQVIDRAIDRLQLPQRRRRKFRLQSPLLHGINGDANQITAVKDVF